MKAVRLADLLEILGFQCGDQLRIRSFRTLNLFELESRSLSQSFPWRDLFQLKHSLTKQSLIIQFFRGFLHLRIFDNLPNGLPGIVKTIQERLAFKFLNFIRSKRSV